jgi:hypothetical protein
MVGDRDVGFDLQLQNGEKFRHILMEKQGLSFDQWNGQKKP